MTIVEFYDESVLHNLSAALYFPADNIYIVGENSKRITKNSVAFEKLLRKHGRTAQIHYVCLPGHDLDKVVEKMCKIARSDDRVIFDVSGGRDYLLAAAGIAAERCLSSNIQIQHTSIRSQKFVCVGNTKFYPDNRKQVKLSCDEVIELHGGKIVYNGEKNNGTVLWNFEEENFADDVLKMWEINKADSRKWNKNTSKLGELENFAHADFDDDKIRLDIRISKQKIVAGNKENLVEELDNFLKELAQKRLITSYVNDEKSIEFYFKNEQVRSCLLKAGNVLELYTYLAAVKAKHKNGRIVYNDACIGAMLDWDGLVHSGTDGLVETENEIDCLLVSGMIPVFVSCKNGNVNEDEFYKLSSVSNKFGGKHAKKVLVATDLQKIGTSMESFENRATQMGIKIIDRVCDMTLEDLADELAGVMRG